MSASSLEADLRAAREAAGVSVEQIQQETRIPADVVQRFEAGKLLNDPAFNDVYLKAFLRSYAGAVGLPPSRVVEAYGAARSGTYRGELNPDGPQAPAAEAPPPRVPEEPPRARQAAEAPPPPSEREPATEKPATDAPPPSASDRAPAVAALSRAPEPEPKSRPPEAPNEHFPKRRVASPSAAAAPRSLDRSWGTIVVGTVVVVLVVAGVLWLLFRDPSPEAEDATATAADTTQAEEAAPVDTTAAAPAATAGPPLALPISVTVLAAGGNGLQAFRTTEIPDERRPHWVEVGDTITLTSNEGVILWGEGAEGMDPSEVTLRWQGFEWKPQAGQVLRITPQNGQRLLDSLQTAGAGTAS